MKIPISGLLSRQRMGLVRDRCGEIKNHLRDVLGFSRNRGLNGLDLRTEPFSHQPALSDYEATRLRFTANLGRYNFGVNQANDVAGTMLLTCGGKGFAFAGGLP